MSSDLLAATMPANQKQMLKRYSDVIMGTMASQITSLAIVSSTVCSGADERKHQSSESLSFVRGIHRLPGNSPHKGPVTRKMFPFDHVIMIISRRVVQYIMTLDREHKPHNVIGRLSRTMDAFAWWPTHAYIC